MPATRATPQISRPVLRWHGGKWKLAPKLVAMFPPHRVYVEPFGGAASVLLRKPKSYAEVYNDLDDDVVNLFRVLRSDDADRLVNLLRLTPFASSEFFAAYVQTEDPIERARRLVIRSFQGFGSNGVHKKTGFRSNINRSGTTPSHDWANYPDALSAIVQRLSGVCILNRDAKEVMVAHDGPETLHYVDPPYMMGTRRDTAADYAHELTDAQHIELLGFLRGLRGKVVLSGYHSDTYQNLLADWSRVDIAALADGASKRTECVWMNFKHKGSLI